jgi:hypothetical protein
MSKKSGNSETTIRCRVSLGMFEEERGVVVELPDGHKASCMADKSQVVVAREPEPGEEVEGRVKVRLLEFFK